MATQKKTHKLLRHKADYEVITEQAITRQTMTSQDSLWRHKFEQTITWRGMTSESIIHRQGRYIY